MEGRFLPVRIGKERSSQESEGPPLHNLPVALTGFVGCQRELGEVKLLLAMTRLLTLTGAGGSGKTRLDIHRDHHERAMPKSKVAWVNIIAIRCLLKVV